MGCVGSRVSGNHIKHLLVLYSHMKIGGIEMEITALVSVSTKTTTVCSNAVADLTLHWH